MCHCPLWCLGNACEYLFLLTDWVLGHVMKICWMDVEIAQEPRNKLKIRARAGWNMKRNCQTRCQCPLWCLGNACEYLFLLTDWVLGQVVKIFWMDVEIALELSTRGWAGVLSAPGLSQVSWTEMVHGHQLFEWFWATSHVWWLSPSFSQDMK